MKKTIVLLFAVVLSFSAFSQAKSKTRSQAKPADTTVKQAPIKYTLAVELPAQDWEVVLGVINQSTAPHNQVAAVQAVILSQLQAQLQKLQKQPADTSAKK